MEELAEDRSLIVNVFEECCNEGCDAEEMDENTSQGNEVCHFVNDPNFHPFFF